MSKQNIKSDILKCSCENELIEYLHKRRLEIIQNDRSSILKMIIKIQEKNIIPLTGKCMSQSELARRAGVDSSLITKIINGTRHPAKYTWFRIGMVGNFNIDEMEDFMEAAGFSFNRMLKTDIILIYAVQKKLKLSDIYNLLQTAQVEVSVLSEFEKGFLSD